MPTDPGEGVDSGSLCYPIRPARLGTKIEQEPRVAVQIENQAIHQMLVEQIAYVEGRTEAEIRSKLDGAGDLEIDSKLGQTVAVRVAVLLNMEDLIRPEDQKRTNLTTVNALEDLISRRVAEHESREG